MNISLDKKITGQPIGVSVASEPRELNSFLDPGSRNELSALGSDATLTPIGWPVMFLSKEIFMRHHSDGAKLGKDQGSLVNFQRLMLQLVARDNCPASLLVLASQFLRL